MLLKLIPTYIPVWGLGVYFDWCIGMHGYFMAVTVRHEPSQIIAVPANLANLHQLLLLGVDVHYLRFTSVIPFHDMASGEIVGNDL